MDLMPTRPRAAARVRPTWGETQKGWLAVDRRDLSMGKYRRDIFTDCATHTGQKYRCAPSPAPQSVSRENGASQTYACFDRQEAKPSPLQLRSQPVA